ncbi:MAG: D-2-hydroxyacid dehydrogenase [Chloroflexi bacterium]|nr:D-2-hydroxyacid dehydrogenase [Chloroflexota bacterium]
MDQINVLVVSKRNMHEGFLKDIEAVAPSVSARDASGLLVKELREEGPGENTWTTEAMIATLEKETRQEQARGWDDRTAGRSLDSLLAEAEVMYASLMWPKDILRRAPRLKWVHISGTGIDRYLGSEIFDGRVIVTNGRGTLAVPIAEHIMALAFSLAKDVPRLIKNKAEKRWERFTNLELTRRTMGIVGMGAIGGNLARMAKGIGMRVIATRRHATEREHDAGYVDEVFPHAALRDMLAESDFVALALPLTEESRKLIGEKELQAMKPSACIINISRGAIIDEAALIRALKGGRIAGAGLDVFEKEPLPPESELWQMPNVILSSHMAGSTDRMSGHVIELFGQNLRRYVSGQALANVVTRDKGY